MRIALIMQIDAVHLCRQYRPLEPIGAVAQQPSDLTNVGGQQVGQLEPPLPVLFFPANVAVQRVVGRLEPPEPLWQPTVASEQRQNESGGDGNKLGYPKGLLWVPQREFRVDRSTGALQYLKNGMPEPLREWGWVVHEHRAKSGYIEQAALFRVLAWTYAYKAYNNRDMQRFLEMYGLPLRLGKYPAGIGDKQRDQLLKAVRNIGNDGAGVVPNNMTIDFIQAMKTGTIDDFLNAIEYWERKQSMAILGGTLTSQADGKTSTNALGEIHDKVRREIMLHDVGQIDPTMNRQIVRPVALINGMFTEDRLPTFSHLTEETPDQAKMVDVLDRAAGMGMEIDVDYAHKVMQIPKADKGAKLLVSSGKPPAIQKQDATLARLAALANTGRTGEQDVTGPYAAQLAALCAPFEQALIQQISAIVAEAGDFNEALAGIEALKAENPKWAEAMALGMAAANLAGRADIGWEE